MDFNEIEITRQKCKKIVNIGYLLIGVGVILFFFLSTQDFPFIGMILFLIGGIVTGVGYSRFNKISQLFKNKYLKELIESSFDKAEYFPNKGVDIKEIYSSDLVKKADRYHLEDLIKGEYEGVSFQTCDVKLEERHVRRTKNGTQVYYVTYFLGRYFSFDFPKDFKSKILVTEGMPSVFGKNYKKIELESVEFNKKFKTYTKDEHDAFYVLTPHLMESILNLEKQNPGTVGLSFIGNKLTIMLDNRINTFELKLSKKIDESAVESLKKDLEVIKKIVHELRLNRNIFIE